MPHVEWDGKEFIKMQPPPLPSIEVRVMPLLHLHENSKSSPINAKPRNTYLPAFTDTCAQTCVAGETLLDQLDLSPNVLMPTTHRIVGVTK